MSKNQKSGNKDEVVNKNEAIKAFKVAAERAGVPSFVLGFDTDGLTTTHLQNVPMNSLSRIVIALFNNMCDHEAGLGHMSDEYRKAWVDLKGEFSALIKKHNARFESIKNSGKTRTS